MDMHMNISQNQFYAKIYRKNAVAQRFVGTALETHAIL